jgi:hypothetical protein
VLFGSQLTTTTSTAAGTARRLVAALAIGLAAVAAASTPARAETVQIPVPQPVVLGAISTVLAGLSVHLDAYGPKHADGRYLSWFQANASSVSISGVGTKTFSLAEIDKKTTKTRRLRYRVLKKDWKDECVIPSIAGKGLDVDNGVLTADLTPVAYDGSISLQVASASARRASAARRRAPPARERRGASA